MNVKEKLIALQKELQAIVDGAKASNRDLTDAEITTIEAKAAEATELKATIERQEKGAALIASVAGLGTAVVEDAEGVRIVGATKHADEWSKKAVDKLRESTTGLGAHGAKSLTTGSVGVTPILGPTVTIDTPPRNLLDLIPVVTPRKSDDDDAGNTFGTMRQNARTNNAGAVPDGGDKPTSIYTFGQVDDKYRVYANKTEDLPWRFLDDFAGITSIVKVQLVADTLNAIEKDVLSGDGADDRFLGLLNTSGLVTQAWTTDLLTTLSNAKYGFLGADRPLTGWALHPTDLQKLEQLRENGTTGAFLFKSRAEIEDYVGAPIVLSAGLPAGTAIAGEWASSELLPLGDDELILDAGKRTTNNTFLMMFEGRYGFRIKKPSAFTKVTLHA